MKKLFLISFFIALTCIFSCEIKTSAFTRIVDLVFDGEPVEPDKLEETLQTIRDNKKKNKNIKNPKKLQPDKLFEVKARWKNPKNIQLEIDTSQVIVKSDKDIQAVISNEAFLDAINEATMLWQDVAIANVRFLPLKFASVKFNKVDPEDGKNVVTFRTIEAPEGTPDTTAAITIVTYARTPVVTFMNKEIKVKPGTILDADIVFDPNNDPCFALFTTMGDFVIGGDLNSPVVEGGIDSMADLSNCQRIFTAELTDQAIRALGTLLGLESSAIASAATSRVARNMIRYALTNDDIIGLANLYPNKENLIDHGTLTGKVTLNKKTVKGAHVVVVDRDSGEPVTGEITNLKGRFTIRALQSGIYEVYVEPLDGPIRPNALPLNFYGFMADLNFATKEFPTPIIISKNKRTHINLPVKELSASAFNINYVTGVLKEEDVTESGGAFLLPIRIAPGEMQTDVQFWGDNISTSFGNLSISGPGITVSNVRAGSIPISLFVKCEDCEDSADKPCKRDPRCLPTQEITEEPNQIPGILADITADITAQPGPRNIIFRGEQIDVTHPSFNLIDQISGGIAVTEE